MPGTLKTYLPREARFDVNDEAAGISIALAYQIDATDEMNVDATATPNDWVLSEAVLYDVPATFGVGSGDMLGYADLVRKGTPPFQPYATATQAPFSFKLTNTFLGHAIVLLARLKQDDRIATIAGAASGATIPTLNLCVGDAFYCSIFRVRGDDGSVTFRYCQEQAPSIDGRVSGSGAGSELVDVDQCPALPEDALQFFAIFAFGSVLKQMFNKPATIGSDYLRSTFDAMEDQGIWSADFSLDPVALALLSSLWTGLQNALPAPREHLQEADKLFRIFIDSKQPTEVRLIALAGFLGHSIMTVVEWVPEVRTGEVVAEDVARDLRSMTGEIKTASAETAKQLETAKKVIPAKAAQCDQALQREAVRRLELEAAERDLVAQLAQMDGPAKKRMGIAFAAAGNKLWAVRKRDMTSYWKGRIAKGEAIDLNAVAGATKRAEGHFVTKGGGWKLGGLEEAFEYQIATGEIDKQALLDQIRQRYVGDVRDGLEKMTENFFKDGSNRRVDHLIIDHKTKSVMVTDYTGSYNNPMSGSFKRDHRTKTTWYLEAFLSQQKKLGRDYLTEGYATRAWEPYWREPR